MIRLTMVHDGAGLRPPVVERQFLGLVPLAATAPAQDKYGTPIESEVFVRHLLPNAQRNVFRHDESSGAYGWLNTIHVKLKSGAYGWFK